MKDIRLFMPFKYLGSNESILYQISGVFVNREEGFNAFLTDKRLTLLKRTRIVFLKDSGVFRKKILDLDTSAGKLGLKGCGQDIPQFHLKLNKKLYG